MKTPKFFNNLKWISYFIMIVHLTICLNFLTIDVTSKLISKKIGEEEYVYSIC